MDDMLIPLNLTRLQKKSQLIEGELSPEELAIDPLDELIHITQPLSYSLNADWMEEAALVQGNVELPVEYECSRCLKRFVESVELTGYALHLPLKGEESVEIIDDCVDLTPFLREDILLGLPQHPLCRSNCPGIAPDDTETEKSGQPGDPAWSQLDNLKFDKD
jgi:uncharacterized protein